MLTCHYPTVISRRLSCSSTTFDLQYPLVVQASIGIANGSAADKRNRTLLGSVGLQLVLARSSRCRSLRSGDCRQRLWHPNIYVRSSGTDVHCEFSDSPQLLVSQVPTFSLSDIAGSSYKVLVASSWTLGKRPLAHQTLLLSTTATKLARPKTPFSFHCSLVRLSPLVFASGLSFPGNQDQGPRYNLGRQHPAQVQP